MRTVALVLVVLMVGCGKTRAEGHEAPPLPEAPIAPGPGRPRGPITTEEQAVRRFQLAWAEEVVPPISGFQRRGVYESWLALGDGGPRYQAVRQVATRERCTETKKWSYDADASTEKGLDYFGSPALLARDGDCWRVYSGPVHVGSHIEALLGASDGALLYVYVVPEG